MLRSKYDPAPLHRSDAGCCAAVAVVCAAAHFHEDERAVTGPQNQVNLATA